MSSRKPKPSKPTASMRALRLQKRPVILYAEPAQFEALKALAARTGKTQQELLRAGLDFILSKG